MTAELRIGIVGLDTSHVVAFAELLHTARHAHHVPGARIVAAWPGGSPDFPLSINRVEGFTRKLRDDFSVDILPSIEAVAERSDAVLLETVDGRRHLEQFQKLAPFGKPVFIDKPIAVTSADARAIADLARQRPVPVLSCSSLRYAEGLATVLADAAAGPVIGADFFGPMSLEATQPGLFWYGIHTVEMLYATLGAGCREVTAATTADHDLVLGRWQDGRLGSIRGNRNGNGKFGGLVHREQATAYVDVYANPKPYYASLIERVLAFFRSRVAPIAIADTIEIVRFIEAANESRTTGKSVAL